MEMPVLLKKLMILAIKASFEAEQAGSNSLDS